ncbi:hypothetical protein JR316_0010901 [Psilocybe cubensis]|uniref:Uncharacterized protein n=2 Tax=Psilocybe cubensis TaxID=181762 RepID=A0ACB8GND6_PSICU|nr:hypothetical protein JR316_0010901 [Psilocybe cubensis]KAH9476985.1 hypothetical protein JR316_0010901 [Psilocybe cubensis]
MGAIISTIQPILQRFKTVLNEYEAASKRISLPPGIPQLNSSIPFWTIPLSPIAHHGRDTELPQYADIVIIGSGITGASIAKALLECSNTRSTPLSVVMVEARDACSGATGRNGGHASPIIYNEYFRLKKAHGATVALQILRFRLAHITALIEVAKAEGLSADSQARLVDNFDAFLQPEFFEKATDELKAFLKEVPSDIGERFGIVEDRDAIEELQLATSIVGLIIKPGASIHPYRLVTGILSKLLDNFSNFQLHTRTPCTGIMTENGTYVIATPKGDIKARHVVHATNAWSSHLLPGLREKIVPWKAHMSSQRPGKGLSSQCNLDSKLTTPQNSEAPAPTNVPTCTSSRSNWTGTRAYVFYPGHEEGVYDYLTQLLPTPIESVPSKALDSSETLAPKSSLPTAGELMFGGGAMLGGMSESALLNVVGVTDDSHPDFAVEAYLSGSLPMYFGRHWGEEGSEADDIEAGKTEDVQWGKGRVKAVWSGLVGLSADANPWVGRVPPSVSGRREPAPQPSRPPYDKPSAVDGEHLAPAGEWVCAGYSGEGMVHAWLSGRALARMILGNAGNGSGAEHDLELPEPFLITENRIKRTKIRDITQIGNN